MVIDFTQNKQPTKNDIIQQLRAKGIKNPARIKRICEKYGHTFARPHTRHFKTQEMHKDLKRMCFTEKRERMNLPVMPSQTPTGELRWKKTD